MKKTLSLLLISALSTSLCGQVTPFNLNDIEFTLLHKLIDYNRIQFVDAGSSAVYEQIDFRRNSNRKILEAKDSVYSFTSYHWNGNISANRNVISVMDSGVAMVEDRFYWDNQFRDTLIESYVDTNSNGTLDKAVGMRMYYGSTGIDSAKLVVYEGPVAAPVLIYIPQKNANNQITALVAYFDFMGMRLPALTYSYTWSGNAINMVELSDAFMGQVLFRLQIQNNANNEITAVTEQSYDSTASQWVDTETYLFQTQSIFGIGDEESLASVEFFPNPVTDWINILLTGKVEVEITTMEGRTVLKTTLSERMNREAINHLPAGSYLLHVRGEDYSRSFKLLKQ